MSQFKFTVGAWVRGLKPVAPIAAFASALAIHSVVHASGNEIVVGQLFDQSPAWIEAGRDYAAGAKTYFDLINSEGGINGKRLVYVTRNSSGNAADISRAATELIGDAKADVLFGPIGDTAMRTLAEMPLPDLQGIAIQYQHNADKPGPDGHPQTRGQALTQP